MRFPAGLALVVVTAGCSQAAALAPVGGNHLTVVRFAANDVLLSKGVAVMVAPVCTLTADDVSCQGSTTDGTTIVVSSVAATKTELTVTVGTDVLYQGPIQDILDAAGRPTG